jgi:hypothetical protein
MYLKKADLKTLAGHFGRTQGAIRARLMKLELEEFY